MDSMYLNSYIMLIRPIFETNPNYDQSRPYIIPNSFTLEELDILQTDKLLGISCTGLWEYPKFLQEHKARKIILHRDLKDVNDSLVNEIETNPISEDKAKVLDSIDGMHVQFNDLFNPDTAKTIYEYALNKPFDPVRHAYLVEMNIQPNFGMLFVKKEVLRDFKRRIA